MFRSVVVAALLLGVAGLAFAENGSTDSEITITQNTPALWYQFETVVKALDPDVAMGYDFLGKGDVFDFYSVAVYKKRSNDILLWSGRIGGAGFDDEVDKLAAIGANLHLDGLTQRYVPDWPLIGAGLKAAGKYARVGGFFGRNFSEADWSLIGTAGIGFEWGG